MTNSAKRDMWRDRIERCLMSGMSISEWCKLNRVNHSTFYYWVSKFRREEPSLFPTQNTSEWVEITKEALAAKVAMVPIPKGTESLAGDNVCSNVDTVVANNYSGTTPAIHARINGVEMSISPGSKEADIASVFKAASLL